MKRGKKYQDAVKAYDRSAQYDVAEAIDLVKKNATAKFDETIELHLRTGCDGRHAEQQIRGAVVLPHGTGKTVKVLVFAKGTKVDEAQAAGADFVGGEVPFVCFRLASKCATCQHCHCHLANPHCPSYRTCCRIPRCGCRTSRRSR